MTMKMLRALVLVVSLFAALTAQPGSAFAMTIAIANSAGTTSASPNPTVQLPRQGSALNNLLLAVCAQQSPTVPNITSDSQGNLWTRMASSFTAPDVANPAGLSVVLAGSYQVGAGADTVGCDASANSAFGILSLSGVLAGQPFNGKSTPFSRQAASYQQQTDVSTAANIANPGDWVVALIVAFGNVTFTQQQPGWTVARSIPGANGVTMELDVLQPSQAGYYIAEWSVSSPAPCAAVAVGIPHG